jgi:hypothetical protein
LTKIALGFFYIIECTRDHDTIEKWSIRSCGGIPQLEPLTTGEERSQVGTALLGGKAKDGGEQRHY